MEQWTAPTVHQLRLFLVIAEELHFGRAAARMFMTQPALSRQLDALERRLGVRLVARTSRTVELTTAGLAIRPVARTVVDAMHGLRRTADQQARAVAGKVVIGTVGAEGAMDHSHAILAELRCRHPELYIELRLLDLVEHYESLRTGDVDVVLCRPPAPEDIQTHHLATEPRVACVPADDHLAGHQTVTLAQLSGRPVVSHPAESPQVWRDFWAVDPRPDGSPVRYGPVVHDVESALTAVVHGHGIAFMPAAARRFFPRPGVVFLDVVDLSPCTSALAWHATCGERPNVMAVRQAARAAWPPPCA